MESRGVIMLLGVLGRRVSSGYALDPAKVKLLLHFDGNYNDSSPNNHTMTSGGNVSISTSEPKFGSGKLQFGDTPTRDGLLNPQTYSTLATIDHLRFRFLPWRRRKRLFLQLMSRHYTRLWCCLAAVISQLVMLH